MLKNIIFKLYHTALYFQIKKGTFAESERSP
jgi:hypothetical protein